METYNPQAIEKKWQKYWEEHPELFAAQNDSVKEKKYILDMFPYPSGEGLHVGHVESYTATDIVSRYFRMQGKNVLHPQGWDAFGLPAENYAIKTGTHPSITTQNNIGNFTRQIKSLGMSYDWSREINTSNPEYYKWTQWFFLLLYKNGLAYKKMGKVNWCPSCQTVLANEQVEDGICERCKNEVVQKDLEQWYFKITDFIEKNKETAGLIDGLEKIDWPDSTKAAQQNWIGKSEGTEFEFKIKDTDLSVDVYTTRVDTVFGVTYVVIGPEHPVIEKLASQIGNYEKIKEYVNESKKKTDLERMEAKEKTGVILEGLKVINPFNEQEVPLFVADYVLSQYGTGAVMAVPAHDERDWDFAEVKKLCKKFVIFDQPTVTYNGRIYDTPGLDFNSKENNDFLEKILIKNNKVVTSEYGYLINSGKYSGMHTAEAREKMTEWLEKNKIGKKKINYRLRDWLVSRQRYWGAPIPIIYCEDCGEVAVPENDLPVELPTDVDFKPTGESPLVYSETFHNVSCPKCGKKARRESDTMDTFVCSSWYYLRYADPHNQTEFASKETIKKWLPVDIYVGGAEHSVLHLLYARFFTKVLHNLGFIDFDEPFLKMRHQGIILAEDGRKMSKSLGNVVNPDDIVSEFGADSLRMFEMFMGPLEAMKPWNTKGIVGIKRFLEKTFNYVESLNIFGEEFVARWVSGETEGGTSPKNKTILNKTIAKVTKDIEEFKFNTAISQLMILRNAFYSELGNEGSIISKNDFETFLILLAPFAPHIVEEIWCEQLKHEKSIFLQQWPAFDPELIHDEEVEMVVQVNGKVRERLVVARDVTEDEIKETALENTKVKVFTDGKEIKKIIFVPGKLINIVVA